MAKGQGTTHDRSGIDEINEVNRQLCEQVQRWSAATTAAREQARDVEQLLSRIDPQRERREHRPAANGKPLRQLLGDITQSVDSDLHQMLTCARDIASSVEEIAQGALFLADPDNTYVTGHILVVDGGWTAGYVRNF